VRDTWPSLFVSTLENVGAEVLAPAADELLGELDELLGELDEPDAPEALESLGLELELEPDALGVDDELLGLELDEELCAIALAANNAAMIATLVFSMWLTP
jgi:hypothetical protein